MIDLLPFLLVVRVSWKAAYKFAILSTTAAYSLPDPVVFATRRNIVVNTPGQEGPERVLSEALQASETNNRYYSGRHVKERRLHDEAHRCRTYRHTTPIPYNTLNTCIHITQPNCKR